MGGDADSVRHSILLGVYVHPLDELLKWLPEVDFAVLEHRFAGDGRDYIVLIEDCLSSNQGQHEITFTQRLWPNTRLAFEIGMAEFLE